MAWTLTHGKGVKECESMSEIVKSVGVERKEEFLRAVGIK